MWLVLKNLGTFSKTPKNLILLRQSKIYYPCMPFRTDCWNCKTKVCHVWNGRYTQIIDNFRDSEFIHLRKIIIWEYCGGGDFWSLSKISFILQFNKRWMVCLCHLQRWKMKTKKLRTIFHAYLRDCACNPFLSLLFAFYIYYLRWNTKIVQTITPIFPHYSIKGKWYDIN